MSWTIRCDICGEMGTMDNAVDAHDLAIEHIRRTKHGVIVKITPIEKSLQVGPCEWVLGQWVLSGATTGGEEVQNGRNGNGHRRTLLDNRDPGI